MREASKTKAILSSSELHWFDGDGIDIGCGNDPITATCARFDKADGDANCLSKYVSKKYDWVFSSHCLEHMINPAVTIVDWWSVLKPNGHLIVTVPDEDLYEQYSWPSRYNRDHKHTFTLSRSKSWSPVSINMLDLFGELPNAVLVKLQQQCDHYNFKLINQGRDQTEGPALAQIMLVARKCL